LHDNVTTAVAVEAIGDALARFVHHVVAACGADEVEPAQVIEEILIKATETYPTLPELSDEAREEAKKFNSLPDPEPDIRGIPSGDDEQILTGALVLRANGFEVYGSGVSTQEVPFDELPVAVAGMLGAMAAHALTGAAVPADIMSNPGEGLKAFQSAWADNLKPGEISGASAKAQHARNAIARFIRGELREEN
jgi:hypothetical protein